MLPFKNPDPQNLKVLIVDDHPLIVDGYKSAVEHGFDIAEIDVAHNCKEAINKIVACNGKYDVVMLDISLPAYHKLKMNSGEDLGLWIRSKYPEIRFFVLTLHDDQLRIDNIHHLLGPEAFLIKSEATTTGIVSALNAVRNNKIAYGPMVSEILLKNHSRINALTQEPTSIE
ncbi:MAG: response regulator [Bacteroidota bacterium]